jgi:molybdopterin-guanine dinucleotide biosynthesis protein A
MGGDKARVLIGGVRLIDRVAERLAPQVSRCLIAGRSNYGLDHELVTDDPSTPRGPVAGVFAAARHLAGKSRYFVTAPVDAPFLPIDLVERLSANGASIAADEKGEHPTFACWPVTEVNVLWEAMCLESNLSLSRLARLIGARTVSWSGCDEFTNVNSPEDLARASVTHRG